MILLSWFLILSAALLSIGLFGVLSRKKAVAILLGIELMLNAVNITWFRPGAMGTFHLWRDRCSQLLFLQWLQEVAVGLALVISVYRSRNTVIADELDLMKW